MQAMVVFFVAMVCGALAAEPAKAEYKYVYPNGAYPYPHAVVAPASPVVHDYQRFFPNFPVPAQYPFYTVAAPQPSKVAEKTSDVAADKNDGSKYYVAAYPAGFPYGLYLQDKKE